MNSGIEQAAVCTEYRRGLRGKARRNLERKHSEPVRIQGADVLEEKRVRAEEATKIVGRPHSVRLIDDGSELAE